MTVLGIPFGRLVSFGAMRFTGLGSPGSVDVDTQSIQTTPEADRGRTLLSAGAYGRAVRGYAPGSIKPSVSTWQVDVHAVRGAAMQDGFKAIENCYATWIAQWMGTCTHRGVSGWSNQYAELVVLDAIGQTWLARAELLSLPLTLVLGEPYLLTIPLSFILAEDWVQAAGSDTAGVPSETTIRLPFGNLLSFGDMIFSGAGIPDNVATDTQSIQATPTVIRPRIEHPTLPYGYPTRAGSIAPLQSYESTWIVDVEATDPDAEFAAIEECWASWYTAWRNDHTHREIAGCSGQLGLLTCKAADGSLWTAEAEMDRFPIAPQPGETMSFSVKLGFNLTEDWRTDVTAGYAGHATISIRADTDSPLPGG